MESFSDDFVLIRVTLMNWQFIRMPESALVMSIERVSVYVSAALGLVLSTFPDDLAFHTPLRMLCLSCFATVFFVLILAVVVFRSAMNSVKTFMSLAILILWNVLFPLNWSDLFSRFMNLEYSKWVLIITSVVVLVVTVVIICLWDQPQNQNYLRSITVVFFLSGCGFTAYALSSIVLGIIIPFLIQFCRFMLSSKCVTETFNKTIKHVIPIRSVKNGQCSASTSEEAASISLSSETKFSEQQQEQQEEHPLVQQGLIINPVTNRIITIGLKTYNELLDLGYEPDFTKGALCKKNKIL